MSQVDGMFVAQVRAPPGITIDFVFYVAGTRHDKRVGFWDTDGYPRSYHTTMMPGEITDVYAKVTLPQAQEFNSLPDRPLVRQEMRYYDPATDGVVLEWKYDGQEMVPEALRPPGTVVQDTVLCTPMTRTNGTFVTTIRVPIGSVVLYRFRVTKNQSDMPTQVWETDGYRDYSVIALQDAVVEVKAKQPPTQTTAEHQKTQNPGWRCWVA
jgi:hypothetical protein